MARSSRVVSGWLLALVLAGSGAAVAQRGHGAGMMGPHGARQGDMQLFHALFAHRADITRQVTIRSDGVETLTESNDPEVAELLQTHVASMLARIEERRPIHLRDPLFREIFRNAEKIDATSERTAKGVRIVETSRDPYVVRLIQAHANVVSAFIADGHSEMMKDHPLPEPTSK